jgi:hypothetical protein
MRQKLVSILAACAALFLAGPALAQSVPPVDKWQGDLSPIAARDWNKERAAHLVSRAGWRHA